MASNNTPQQQGPRAMPRRAAGQPGVRPTESVRFPASPGVCKAGSTAKGLYRIRRWPDLWPERSRRRRPEDSREISINYQVAITATCNRGTSLGPARPSLSILERG
jgi:hypothetical protein